MKPITDFKPGDWFFYSSPYEIWSVVKVTKKHYICKTPAYDRVTRRKGMLKPEHMFRYRRFNLHTMVIPYFYKEDWNYVLMHGNPVCRDCPPLAICTCSNPFDLQYCRSLQQFWKCLSVGHYRPRPWTESDQEKKFNESK